MVNNVTISGSKSKGTIDANSTTYNESTVTANKDMEFNSGKDTNIKGGKVSGDKVTGNVGGDLNIESKQDSNSYKEENTSSGFGVEVNLDNKGKIAGSGVTSSVNKGNIDSKYDSVTDQSGIYAGNEGFNINVEKNTDLKGGIIGSKAEADKNKISTGTLTYEDIKNKAEYEADSKGIAVDTTKDAEKENAGVTPNIGMPAGDEAESTTKSTIAEGEIEIRDKENQKQDLAGLNRDTQNSLNKLGEIFDKDSIKERQELAGLFGEIAYKSIGDLAIKNGWEEGSAEKNALHALVGGIMSELGGSGFLAGASGAMVNEMIQKKLGDMFEDDPAMHQWASALIGSVVSQIVSGNAQAGASTAASATKNNYFQHLKPIRDIIEEMKRNNALEKLNDGEYYVLSIGIGANITDVARALHIPVDKLKSYGVDGSIGVIIDKSGNIYDNAGIGISADFGESAPGSVTVMRGTIPNFNDRDGYRQNIEGNSITGTVNILGSYINGTFSSADGSPNYAYENGVGVSGASSVQIAVSLNHTEMIGNINNKNIMDSNYERNLEINKLFDNNKNVQAYLDGNGEIRVLRGDQEFSGNNGNWITITRSKSEWIKGWRAISIEEAQSIIKSRIK